MLSRSTRPALLLIMILPMLACQLLTPAPADCRVNMPGAGWVQHRNGDEIAFSVDEVQWTARVDCNTAQLVDGQPARPARARQVLIPVEDTSYTLITADAQISMREYRSNGSHVRIDVGDDYYVAVLSAEPGTMGQAMIRYFIAGQSHDGVIHINCYNHTQGEEQASLPAVASMWTDTRATTVDLVCAAPGFILEISTDITSQMLRQGPTAVPATPAPTTTPPAPGSPT